MSICRNCGGEFDWAWNDRAERWELLEPIGQDGDLHRSFVDANGELRANHRDRHAGGKPTVSVSQLDRPIPPEKVEEEAPLHRRMVEAARVAVGRK